MIPNEKQALITLLECKIERQTGMKIKYLEPKVSEVKKIHEQLEKLTGKKVLFKEVEGGSGSLADITEEPELIDESLKIAKQKYLEKGLINKDTFDQLAQADPTPTKKYLPWMCKMFINKEADINTLRNTIEEFNLFANRQRVEQKDINTYANFEDLKKVVDEINKSGSASLKELEHDYEVVVDTPDLYIACPHTWEASRKLGLSVFAVRDNPATKSKDSAWCTTYANKGHFNDYYFKQNITLYYIKAKGQLFERLKKEMGPEYEAVAFAVKPSGSIEAYNQSDTLMSNQQVTKYRKIIGQ